MDVERMKKLRSVAAIVVLVLVVGDGCSNKVKYTSCDEMRKDHAAPVSQGEHNYNPDLDRDHDGVACEGSE